MKSNKSNFLDGRSRTLKMKRLLKKIIALYLFLKFMRELHIINFLPDGIKVLTVKQVFLKTIMPIKRYGDQ